MKNCVAHTAVVILAFGSPSLLQAQFTVVTADGLITGDLAGAEALLAASPVPGGIWSTISFGDGQSNPYPNNLTTHFALGASGILAPNTSGSYVFGVLSDDGFRLRLNGSVASESEFWGGSVVPSASFTLSAGKTYSLELTHFQMNGGADLALFYSRDGGSFTLLGTGTDITVSPVPEPEWYGLAFALGLIGYSCWNSRRRTRLSVGPIASALVSAAMVALLAEVKSPAEEAKTENIYAEIATRVVKMSATGPKDVFGRFQIGLNPGAHATEQPGDYHPGYAAGLISIGIGENQFLGGENKVEGDGFGGFNFPIVNATVTIDGKTVVRDGKLTL